MIQANLTESQSSTSCISVVKQPQDVVFGAILIWIGGPGWTAHRVRGVKRDFRPMSRGSVSCWVMPIDDTGFPKKGRHSVGVTRQYCGQLGKQDNCQVAVTLSLANHDASLPIAYQLYLPEDWAKDQARRHTAKVPQTIAFQTKPEIALG